MLLLLTGLALAGPDLADSDAGCVGCHAAEAAQWAGSRHAVARSNAIFQASFASMEHPWCLTCHAPGSTTDGVGCLDCHAGGEPAPCARCHEFPFQNHTPATPFTLGANPAQETVSEWQRSAAAARGVTCVDCHMGEHGHRFPGAHDAELVRGLVQAEARVLSAEQVQVRVSAPGAAHRVPTGDPFRRIEVRLATDPDCEQVVGRASVRRVISRTEASWEISEDRTVPPETADVASVRVLQVEVSGRPTWWCLDYRYGDRRFEVALAPEDVGYRIASGRVSPSR